MDFKDVLIWPMPSDINSRKDVSLTRKFYFKRQNKVLTTVPIIAANMHNIGTEKVARTLVKHNMLTALVKGNYHPWDLDDRVFATYGLEHIVGKPSLICLDVANGYMSSFVNKVKETRKKFPLAIIMAGNIATYLGMEDLADAGADIIKVGIGSGSACTTRIKTGVGVPQLEALRNCVPYKQISRVLICSDGGHKTPGDVAKAFVAGADFVMLGGMFAGTVETGNEFYGNASKKAQGEIASYRAAEGRSLKIEKKEGLDDVVLDLLGGLRSACSYVGAHNLEELKSKGTLIEIK